MKDILPKYFTLEEIARMLWILWHRHNGTTWSYTALQVQDRPEQKNKRNSTIQSRTIRVLMIKTVWLPIVRLNRWRKDGYNKTTKIIRGAQNKLSVSSIKNSANVTFHFTSCLSLSVLSHTHKYTFSSLQSVLTSCSFV